MLKITHASLMSKAEAKTFGVFITYEGELPKGPEIRPQLLLFFDWWYTTVEATGVDPRTIIDMMLPDYEKVRKDQLN